MRSVLTYVVRKRANERIVSEYIEKNGCLMLNLSERMYGRNVRHMHLKHRLIAMQFIENPNDFNRNKVDHINRNKLDNRIENLRWCSASDNMKNRTLTDGVEYVFFDSIDEDAVVVNDYGRHQFEICSTSITKISTGVYMLMKKETAISSFG